MNYYTHSISLYKDGKLYITLGTPLVVLAVVVILIL